MTVAELMELLKQHPPTMGVVVAGYEGGYNDLFSVAPVRMVPEVNTQWYYGAHKGTDAGDEKAVTALLLSGENHIARED
ncbi:MAG: hypothetical protein HQM01_14535 [Magnetococcales bacterium]|nr:hypothetical protein [Magnetococcales bacterium]MBF0165696.1 hypothetical protein [Magnetococcales bacterium]